MGNIGNSCKKFFFCLLRVPWGKEDCGFPFQCFVVWNAIAWLQLSRTRVTRSVQRSWSSPPLRRTRALGEKQPQPSSGAFVIHGIQKGTTREPQWAVWYFISTPVTVPLTHLCVSGWGHILLGWLGGWDLSIWALFGSCTGNTGGFRLAGSHGSPSYSEVICLPFRSLSG